jgi:hypothetical protein
MPLGDRVLVPFVRPESLPILLDVAAAVALQDQGTVIAVIVVPEDANSRARAQAETLCTSAEQEAASRGVPCEAMIVEAGDVASAIRATAVDVDASMVVMGWRGNLTTENVLGRTVDQVLGRSSVPVGVLRVSTWPPAGIVFAVSDAQLAHDGGRGVELAATVGAALVEHKPIRVRIVRTGDSVDPLPLRLRQLSDRLHRDSGTLPEAVRASAHAGDLIITAVPPTTEGLREATRHLVQAVPEASVLTVLDVPAMPQDIADALAEQARQPGPDRPGVYLVSVSMSVALDTQVSRRRLRRALEPCGRVVDLRIRWTGRPRQQQVELDVEVESGSQTAALGAVMEVLHDLGDLVGSDLRYQVKPRMVAALSHLDVLGSAISED